MTQLQTELLLAVAEEQQRFESGARGVRGNIWSRVQFRIAKPRGKLRPSPVAGKKSVVRGFEAELRESVSCLVRSGWLRWHKLGGHGGEFRNTQGYKRNRSQAKDVFLTATGKQLVDQLKAERATCDVEAGISDQSISPTGSALSIDVNGQVNVPCPPLGVTGWVGA